MPMSPAASLQGLDNSTLIGDADLLPRHPIFHARDFLPRLKPRQLGGTPARRRPSRKTLKRASRVAAQELLRLGPRLLFAPRMAQRCDQITTSGIIIRGAAERPLGGVYRRVEPTRQEASGRMQVEAVYRLERQRIQPFADLGAGERSLEIAVQTDTQAPRT